MTYTQIKFNEQDERVINLLKKLSSKDIEILQLAIYYNYPLDLAVEYINRKRHDKQFNNEISNLINE